MLVVGHGWRGWRARPRLADACWTDAVAVSSGRKQGKGKKDDCLGIKSVEVKADE